MITFNYQTEFLLSDADNVNQWIIQTIESEGYSYDEINFIFCDDSYLLNINKQYLNHNTYTDIISFDYTVGKKISGDIYISIPRVKENAILFNTTFINELHRVMIHGVLHYCGYKDKETSDKKMMRLKEDYYLSLRKFIH